MGSTIDKIVFQNAYHEAFYVSERGIVSKNIANCRAANRLDHSQLIRGGQGKSLIDGRYFVIRQRPAGAAGILFYVVGLACLGNGKQLWQACEKV